MKKILLISELLTGGGAEKVVANLSLALKDTYEVYIVTYSQSDNEYEFAGKRININLLGSNANIFKKIIKAIKRILIIKKIKKENNIDYSISFLPHTDYVNVFSKTKREKVIIEVSSNTAAAFKGKLSTMFRKYILKKADFVVAVSEGSRNSLVQNYGLTNEKTATIHNSCDINAIKRVLNKEESDDIKGISEKLPQKYITAIGSFRKAKGHWHLIKAFASIADKIPDVSLLILGDGVYRPQYEELIANLGIQENRVIMPGFLAEPYPIIAKSKLFVFSSVYEGFGNVIIEAMACGVPVISTDCDYGPREIIAPNSDVRVKCAEPEMHEYGRLLPPFSLDEDIDTAPAISEKEMQMGNAILEMINDTESLSKYSAKGLVRCMDFDNASYDKKWIRIFDKLEDE